MTPLRVLSLFAGCGAFDLGLERTGGFETVAFCEIEPFQRSILARHWPGVPIFHDVRTLTADRLRADGALPDVIAGGFPCQDVSVAGAGAGLLGARSGLWTHFARLIGDLRPRYAIVENVAALLGRGLAEVLGDLAALGYDAEWHCIPAAAVGAPHRRDRLWLVAYPADAGREPLRDQSGRWRGTRGPDPAVARDDGLAEPLADADRRGRRREGGRARLALGPGTLRKWALAATARGRRRPTLGRLDRAADGPAERLDPTDRPGAWSEGWEHDTPRLARNAFDRIHRRRRLIALGNAVVPIIPELIGRAILAAEQERTDAG